MIRLKSLLTEQDSEYDIDTIIADILQKQWMTSKSSGVHSQSVKDYRASILKSLNEIKEGVKKMEFRFYAANKKANSDPENQEAYDTIQKNVMDHFKSMNLPDLIGDSQNDQNNKLLVPLFKEFQGTPGDIRSFGFDWKDSISTVLNILEYVNSINFSEDIKNDRPVIGELRRAANLINTTYTELDNLLK